MDGKQLRVIATAAILAVSVFQVCWARDLRVTIPRHSELTPVQKLNREGVDAVRKQQFEKAQTLFYKAYLYDPADPFTLNNLGYLAELQGELDRAQKFYALASEQGEDASIDRSNAKALEGKPLSYALTSLKDVPMRVNRMNVQAISLLSDNRGAEAALLLKQALALDPQNSFTLNNLGVANESLGDYDEALKDYQAASAPRSQEPVVVTLDRTWRGKPVSEMAASSAKQLQKRMHSVETDQARATMLTLQGVSAANRNDWTSAKADFLQAYALDPTSAFSLNNLGYVSEKDGDPETAQSFYAKAQTADDANARVGIATQGAAEGKQLVAVATDSDQKIDGQLENSRQLRRSQPTQPGLRHRDGTPVTVPAVKPQIVDTPPSGDNTPAAAPADSAAPGQSPSNATPPAPAPPTPQ